MFFTYINSYEHDGTPVMEILGNSTELTPQLHKIDSLNTSERQAVRIMKINNSELVQRLVNTEGIIEPFEDMVEHRFFFNADAHITTVEHKECSMNCIYDKLLDGITPVLSDL